MQTLSPNAAAILDRMEPNRGYEALEVSTFVPGVTMDRLGEIMHELWVNRYVERFGYSGWRLDRSRCAAQEVTNSQSSVAESCAGFMAPPEPKSVRPEDLFDHGAFSGMFK
jgi:hypothetical protein